MIPAFLLRPTTLVPAPRTMLRGNEAASSGKEPTAS